MIEKEQVYQNLTNHHLSELKILRDKNTQNLPNQSQTESLSHEIGAMSDLLFDVMQKCIQNSIPDVLGGAKATSTNNLSREIEIPGAIGTKKQFNTVHIKKNVEQSMATLPINENCALMINVQKTNAYPTHGAPSTHPTENSWSAQIGIIDLKTMQQTVGVRFSSNYQYDLATKNLADFSNKIEFIQFSTSSDSQDVNFSKSDISDLLQNPKLHQNRPLSAPQALHFCTIMSSAFNADLLKACKDYSIAITNDLEQVQAISGVMQMGLNGQIDLQNNQLIHMAKRAGISTHLSQPEASTNSDYSVGSIGVLNAARGLARRRLNEAPTASSAAEQNYKSKQQKETDERIKQGADAWWR